MGTTGIIRLQRLTNGKLRQARELRSDMTHAEELLWERLRRNQLGVKFRRQQVIEGFIADFYCEKAKLVIEVDGTIHDTDEQTLIDEHRKNVFESIGLKEIRFSNEHIDKDIETVIVTIKKSLSPLLAKEGTRRCTELVEVGRGQNV